MTLSMGELKLGRGSTIYYSSYEVPEGHVYRFNLGPLTDPNATATAQLMRSTSRGLNRAIAALNKIPWSTGLKGIFSVSAFEAYRIVTLLGIILLCDGYAFEIEEIK